MADTDLPDDLQRWTAKRRAALVLSILKGDTTPQEAARKHGLTVAEVESWRDKFLSGAENALRTRPRDEDGQQGEYVRRLERKVGQMALDLDIMKEAIRPYRPFDQGTSSE
jgi:transposase-like protein